LAFRHLGGGSIQQPKQFPRRAKEKARADGNRTRAERKTNMYKISDDSRKVNNDKTPTNDEVVEAIAELCHARYAVGYSEADNCAFLRANLFRSGVAWFDVPPEKRAHVISIAKQLLDAHLVDVALARAYETTWNIAWPPDAYQGTNAQNTFRMRDLLDARMGCEAADNLVLKVRAQLNESTAFKEKLLLDEFLERHRADLASGRRRS